MKWHVGDIQFKVFLYYAQFVKFNLGPLIVGKPIFFPFLESSSLATHEMHVVLNWLKNGVVGTLTAPLANCLFQHAY